VAEHAMVHGGYAAFGYAFWKSQVLLMAEFHAVWVTPDRRLVDVTPAAEGERDVCFARDRRYGPDYDFSDRPADRAMSIVGKVGPEAVAQAIAELSPARMAYERRRADHAGLDLETHLARKIGRTPLAVTVEELIAACEERDSLVVPTASRVLCRDPEAFRIVQSKVSELERQVRLEFATKDAAKPISLKSGYMSADATAPRPFADERAHDAVPLERGRDHAARSGPAAGSASSGFGELIEALLNPNYDVVAIDLAESGPKVMSVASSRPKRDKRSPSAADPVADDESEEIARLIRDRLGAGPKGAAGASKGRS